MLINTIVFFLYLYSCIFDFSAIQVIRSRNSHFLVQQVFDLSYLLEAAIGNYVTAHKMLMTVTKKPYERVI